MSRVSIVICTFNRADSLRETLHSLRHQRHSEFEVVVVNGPSTDHTDQVLAEFKGSIRAEVCPVANLSVSRNIGIRSAAAEIVAFIDDDALPEFDWLRQALPAFADDTVGGVGGIVFDHSGMALQYRFSAANRFGEATSRADAPYDEYCFPGSFEFPYLQGTNALFRRSALEEIGGFDETFDYYLDETDVCCRMVDAGYLLRQLPDAPVHHKFLPSSIRTPERVVTNWFPIIKNQTYFAYRHALGSFLELDVIDRCRANVDRWHADALFHERAGRLPAGTSDRMLDLGGRAMGTGIQIGRERHWLRLDPLPPASNIFAPYPVIDSSRRRRIAILCGDYPPRSTGGIARFIGDVAPELAARGHEVRVLTRSDEHGRVDLEDGVWVHRIECPSVIDGGVAAEALPHINAYVTASAAELERIAGWTSFDLVYGPAWDVDVMAGLRTTNLPVVSMLATPVAVAAAHTGDLSIPANANNLGGLMRAEREVFVRSDLLHAISAAVVETVEDEYQLAIGERARVGAIGLRDRRVAGTRRGRSVKGKACVLFVGRLEARKGIDDLLDAIAILGPRYEGVAWQIAGPETVPVGSPSRETLFRHRHRSASWLERVSFLGGVDDTTLDRLYGGADLVVLPSRYESFGLVMVEAMMHGRAQVSCAIGGINEVVRHGIDGLLVPPASPNELATAIAELLDDPARRSAMGKSGRIRYERELTIAAATTRLEAILAGVQLHRVGDAGIEILDDEHPRTCGRDGAPLAMGPRTRVVISPAPDVLRRALLFSGGGGFAALRTRSTTEKVPLATGWNRVDLPDTADPVVVTRGEGSLQFGGVVTVDV